MSERYLRTIRLLAECLQEFERVSTGPIRRFELTPAQFDIIATLGNTSGMSCKELGEKTLITKGTMTGVLDRLEKKHLLERTRSLEDRRSFFIRLTPQGESLFSEVFPEVIKKGRAMFAGYRDEDFEEVDRQLLKLKKSITTGGGC